ncbi:ABC transporter, ATP binding protein [Aeropyrum pernix K1]|uniref:ABC transporter, ATP binding protein n=1 Tax=Aeropyrum pernix (strain ATCC 700893 / DSM 11879 / JCM 9820 / NBRC 100138 / K1) TaxID=272557 RepID=Q9YCF6_AERPE|nr:ABC transporter ATP-binding protein [Aeropyrum pernix]BAA80292.2 ABC transporter, ATP binding protein [Aeropyrum pernix K1]
MGPLLNVSNVEIMYHPFILVIKNLSLSVEKGSITCLIGPNGAGKTTLLKAVSGVIKYERGRVTRGSIQLEGEDITNREPDEIARRGVIYVMEGRRIFKELTTEENLVSVAYAAGASRDDIRSVLSYFPRLKERLGEKAGNLSGGEQQMLAIAMALLYRPKLLMLDEPSLGLAPKITSQIYATIKMLHREEGLTILLAEQNARKALEISDYGYVIENGRIVLEGSAEELRLDKDVAEFYLGMGKRTSYAQVKWYRRKKRWV